MNGYIIAFLLAAVIGTAVWAHLPQWMTTWKYANKDTAADVRFLQSIPKGMEDEK